MEKVIPRAINYSDIKPEAIENMVRVVRFTPTATVNNAKPNDIIRFMLLGNGFYDPYSAYIRIEVTCTLGKFTPASGKYNGMFLDRSAHSLIGRLVVKSQGSELERIEQYDVVAAMINDMLYSQEQSVFHHFEGMPTSQVDLGATIFSAQDAANLVTIVSPVTAAMKGAPAVASRLTAKTYLGYNRNGDYVGTNVNGNCTTLQFGSLPFLQQNSQDLLMRFLGDQGFWKLNLQDILKPGASIAVDAANEPGLVENAYPFDTSSVGLPRLMHKYFRFVGYNGGHTSDLQNTTIDLQSVPANLGEGAEGQVVSPATLQFCIPIYSGILGVLMPDKKMLPLSLLPLEVEFTVNPYAFYSAGDPTTDSDHRAFTISTFHIYTHMLFFEQELHRSLESVVAENGIFIHFNSFYLAPVTTFSTQAVSGYAQINVHAKSINSVHFVFIYAGYESLNGPRKLHFVNHNLTSLQIRNGTELTPSEPIQGNQSLMKSSGQHIQYLMETLKAWNKLHDPTTDGALTGFNFTTDAVITQDETLNFAGLLFQQANIGRCQYAVSMEGEELGQDKTIITGRKGLIPFDINFGVSQKSDNVQSYQFTFVRADYVLYVRPDLVVSVLGK